MELIVITGVYTIMNLFMLQTSSEQHLTTIGYTAEQLNAEAREKDRLQVVHPRPSLWGAITQYKILEVPK